MMYRSAVRISLKRSFPPHRFQNSYSKFFGTATKKKSWKWKSTLLRWGLALGGVYYYNKSDIFSNGLGVASQGEELKDEKETLNRLTVDAIVEERRKLRSEKVHETKASDSQTNDQQEVSADADVNHDEESRTDAFDPETGEINWDCPCLGGMAHGPCGEEFKAAFSCFIHSKEEPKGAECIEKFTTMQGCFRKHPDMYGAELDGEEDAVEATEEDRDTKDVEDGFKGSEEVPQSSDNIAQSPSQTDLSVNQGNLDNPDRKL